MTTAIRSRITGTGMYVPERVVTNHDLAQRMDTSDEWIRQRSGIAERRIAAVREVLESIHLGETPELLVFNRIDMLPPGVGESLAARHGGVAVSALRGTGLRELLERADEMLSEIDRRDGASFEPLALLAQGG